MKNLFIFLFTLSLSFCIAQEIQKKIQWKTIQQADSLQLSGNKKPLFVDLYTDWCYWCKVLDKKTFTEPSFVDFITENYIPVKFNAETREDIIFKDKKYKYIQGERNGINALTYIMLGGQLSYPSMAVVSVEGRTIAVVAGYYNATDLIQELNAIKKE